MISVDVRCGECSQSYAFEVGRDECRDGKIPIHIWEGWEWRDNDEPLCPNCRDHGRALEKIGQVRKALRALDRPGTAEEGKLAAKAIQRIREIVGLERER